MHKQHIALKPVPQAMFTSALRFRSAPCLLLATILLGVTGGCASARFDVARPQSHALEDPSQTSLGRAMSAQAGAQPGMSGFQIIDTGSEALQARAALADAAERTLDLKYFSVDGNRATDVLLHRIAAAGQRGVRVRILLDDIHAPNRGFALRALALAPTVEVRLFNPFLTGGVSGIGRLLELVGDAERLNRRMHNKLWVADNAIGIVGGRNIGDEYFDTDAQANFSDLDLLAAGPVVEQLSRCFDEYWNTPAAVPFSAFIAAEPGLEQRQKIRLELEQRLSDAAAAPYLQWLQGSEFSRALQAANLALNWAPAQAGCDPPDKPLTDTTDDIKHSWLDGAGDLMPTNKELIVVSPYFIPSEKARRHLGELRQRGVRVVVLTNSLASTDSPAAHAGYARYRADLLRRGVELFELRPEPGAPHPISHRWRGLVASTLHAKIVIVDRARAIVGSANQDPRSRLYNTESWVKVESPALASGMAALFDESTQADHSFRVVLRQPDQPGDALSWITEDKGQAVRHDTEPGVGWWRRFWSILLSIVVPEHLL